MVMDYARSCYSANFNFRTGDPAILTAWSFADPGARLFPYWHSFDSKNWQDHEYQAGDIGEQDQVQLWLPGTPLGRGQPTYNCVGIEDWWTGGIPIGMLAPPVDVNGVPLCCTAERPCVCAGGNLPDTLTLTFTDGCFATVGVTVTLTRNPGSCQWTGSAELNFLVGLFTATLSFAGPQASASSISFTVVGSAGDSSGYAVADDSSQCSPLAITFTDVDPGLHVPCTYFDMVIST
jgi:hypothetical protein